MKEARSLMAYSIVSGAGWMLSYLVNEAEFVALGSLPVVALPVFLIATALQCARLRVAWSIVTIYLWSCTAFFTLGVLLWPFASTGPHEFQSLVDEVLEPIAVNRAASLLGVSVSLSLISFCASKQGPPDPHPLQLRATDTRQRALRLGWMLMGMSLPFVCYRLYLEYSFIAQSGYLALYTDGLGAATISPWLTIFTFSFGSGFGLVLMGRPSRQMLIRALAIFLLVAVLDGLKGARGALIVPLIFSIWYFTNDSPVRLKLRRLVPLAMVFVVAFVGLTVLRDESDDGSPSLANYAVDSFATQGRSLQLTALYFSHADDIAAYSNLTIFSNVLMPVTVMTHPELRVEPQSVAQVLYSNNLKHVFTYVLNSEYYLSGGGVGGVHLIELIEGGPAIFVVFSLILGWLLAVFPRLMQRDWFHFLAPQFISHVVYLPRGEFFPNVLIIGKWILLCALCVVVLRVFRRRRPSVHA